MPINFEFFTNEAYMNCRHSAFETYVPLLKERTNANIFPGGEDKSRTLTNPGIVSESSMRKMKCFDVSYILSE